MSAVQQSEERPEFLDVAWLLSIDDSIDFAI